MTYDFALFLAVIITKYGRYWGRLYASVFFTFEVVLEDKDNVQDKQRD